MHKYFLDGNEVSSDWIQSEAGKLKISASEFIKRKGIQKKSVKSEVKTTAQTIGEIPAWEVSAKQDATASSQTKVKNNQIDLNVFPEAKKFTASNDIILSSINDNAQLNTFDVEAAPIGYKAPTVYERLSKELKSTGEPLSVDYLKTLSENDLFEAYKAETDNLLLSSKSLAGIEEEVNNNTYSELVPYSTPTGGGVSLQPVGKEWTKYNTVDLKKKVSKSLKQDINTIDPIKFEEAAKNEYKRKLISDRIETDADDLGGKYKDAIVGTGTKLGLLVFGKGLGLISDTVDKEVLEYEKFKKEAPIYSIEKIDQIYAAANENIKALSDVIWTKTAAVTASVESYKNNKSFQTKENYEKINNEIIQLDVLKTNKDEYVDKISDDLLNNPDVNNLKKIADIMGRSYLASDEIPSTITASLAKGVSGGATLGSRLAKYIQGEGSLNYTAMKYMEKTMSDASDSEASEISKPQTIDNINSVGDVLKFGQDLFAGQVANTVFTASTGGVGLILVSASSAGQTIKGMDDEAANDPNIKYSDAQYLGASLMSFAAEYVTEKVGLDQFKVGKKGLRKAFEIDGMYTLQPGDYMDTAKKFFWNTNAEGSAELLSQLGNNFSDKYILDKDVSMMDGLRDSYISGAFMSGVGFQSLPTAAEMYKTFSTKKQYGESIQRSKSILTAGKAIDDIVNKGKLTKDDRVAIKTLNTQIEALMIEDAKARKTVEGQVDKLSNASKKTLRNVYINNARAKAEIDELNANESLPQQSKKAAIKLLADKINMNQAIGDLVLRDAEFSKDLAKNKAFTAMWNAINNRGTGSTIVVDNISDIKAALIKKVDDQNLTKEAKESAYKQVNDAVADLDENNSGVNLVSGAAVDIGKEKVSLIIKGSAISENGDLSVLSHETGHNTIFAALLTKNIDVIRLVNELESYAKSIYGKKVGEAMAGVELAYANEPEAVMAEEKFIAITTLLRSRNIDRNKDRTLQTKVYDKLNQILPKLFKDKNVRDHFNINTGKDLFDLALGYADSFESGKMNSFVEAIAKGEFEVKNQKDNSVNTNAKLSLSPKQIDDKIYSINEEIDSLASTWVNGGIEDKDYYKQVETLESQIDALENPTEEIEQKQKEIKKPVKSIKEGIDLEGEAKAVVKDNKGKIASEKVQAAYNAKGINAAVDIIDLFKPITKALVDKRRDAPGFDRKLLTDEIETGDGGILYLIRKYDPSEGVPLAAYINKYLPVRAITASRRVLDKEFSKDVNDQKDLMSTETADQSFEDKDVDKPKYKNLLEQNILEPSVIESIKAKVLSTLRTLKTRIDAPVSINKTVTPIIAEIKDAMGKQADIDLKTAMGGKKDNQFRSWLLKHKKATLENMTTTWLMGANGVGGIPQAIQKRIDGKWVNYPEWVDKKIDRESVNTNLAGRTSGAELARRLPNAVNNVSNADYLGQFIDSTGNPIRGRKESLAKATAEEIAFDIIKEDLANGGELSQALEANQERLGLEVKEIIKIDFVRQSERGNIKLSLSPKAKIDFENKTNKLFDNINLKNTITKGRIKLAVNKTFKEWAVEDKEELINKFTVYLRSAVQTIGRNFRNKGKKYELKIKESIKAFTEANDDGSAIAARLQTVKSVSENFRDPEHLKDLQEINRDFGVDLLSKFGQKKGLELLASFWYPSVAGRTSKGSKAIFKGKGSFKSFLKDIQSGYDEIIPFESIDISRKDNSVSQNIMSGNISARQKAIDNKMSNDAWDFTVFAVESFANKVKDNDNGFTNDHLASLLTSLIYETNSALRSAAPVVGILIDSRIKDRKKYDYDHSKPARYVLSRLMDKFVDNKEVDLSDVKKDYVVTVIPKVLSKKLTKAGLRSMMPYDYKEGEGVQTRLKYATENLENTIRFSKSINDSFNQVIEDKFGIEEYKRFSAIVGKRRGANKGNYRLFIPPSAEDFMGLLYDFLGKGKNGDLTKEWFRDVLLVPYKKGIIDLEKAKQSIRNTYLELLKDNNDIKKKLRKKTPDGDYTYDQALRVYLWTKAGYEVPGLTERDGKKLNELIGNDPEMTMFANKLSTMSQQKEGWTPPSEYWDAQTLLTDLANLTEGSNRKFFLQEFIQNSDIMFSAENMNKLRAALGNNWVDAMEDSLFRMKNGTNRSSGSNKAVNRWNNWVNNSTGAIMFFNRRSAVLQLISATNFVNWSDNNPLNAAAAFANQPQYWADFAMIFNSPKLKERRSGLKTEVSQAEIANASADATNKPLAIMSYLLKIGFTPTQIADSLAIAGGGAPFYRNRVNTYKSELVGEEGKQKRKYTDAEAEAKAFDDFSEVSDESQQSSDPSLVSSQQASVLGRLVLAFQNTPQQYMRLTKKAVRDLINGRGDWKTHVSKIVYYTAIQNMIFSALQTGLFALLPGFDDEEEDDVTMQKELDEKTYRILNSMTDTILKGSGLYGAVVSTLKNIILEYYKQEAKGYKADHAQTLLQAASLSPPIGSKLRKLYSATETAEYEKDVMSERGWSITADGKFNLSPKYALTGQLAAAFANIPLDRIVDETTSIAESFDDRNTKWQRLATGLGWKSWEMGAKNEENDLIKNTAKIKREAEGVIKAENTRIETKKILEKSKADARAKRKQMYIDFSDKEKAYYDKLNVSQRSDYWESSIPMPLSPYEKAAAKKKKTSEDKKAQRKTVYNNFSKEEKAKYDKLTSYQRKEYWENLK